MSIVMFICGPLMKSFIDHKKIYIIVCSWFVINFVNCFFQIASESWCVSILDEKHKPTATIMLTVGQTMGIFATYNLFIPLNSVEWLNKNIYKSHPIKVCKIAITQETNK